jgi:hypothetical protein
MHRRWDAEGLDYATQHRRKETMPADVPWRDSNDLARFRSRHRAASACSAAGVTNAEGTGMSLRSQRPSEVPRNEGHSKRFDLCFLGLLQ